MKGIFHISCTTVLLLFTSSLLAQSDSISNSFDDTYKKNNPTLNYSYDPITQIHDYSGNWDLDKDGIKDRVSFVGTGGAHLYYFLRVVLSSDNKLRNFPYLISDLPVLPPTKETSNTGYNPIKSQSRLVVGDFQKNGLEQIYIRLDNASILANQKILKQKGINTRHIILSFKNGKLIPCDFEILETGE